MSYSATFTDMNNNTWEIRIKSGNYRVYKNDVEVHKSDGTKKKHLEDY